MYEFLGLNPARPRLSAARGAPPRDSRKKTPPPSGVTAGRGLEEIHERSFQSVVQESAGEELVRLGYEKESNW
jgi:hypothetical protein